MPRYVCAVLLPSALLLPAPAVAVPICQYVATTDPLRGEQVLANPCVGYAGNVRCVPLVQDSGSVGLEVVICRPA